MSNHEVCGREIAQLMEEAREKDAEIERLKREYSALQKRYDTLWRVSEAIKDE